MYNILVNLITTFNFSKTRVCTNTIIKLPYKIVGKQGSFEYIDTLRLSFAFHCPLIFRNFKLSNRRSTSTVVLTNTLLVRSLSRRWEIEKTVFFLIYCYVTSVRRCMVKIFFICLYNLTLSTRFLKNVGTFWERYASLGLFVSHGTVRASTISRNFRVAWLKFILILESCDDWII